MGFYERLTEATKREQEMLFSVPFVVRALSGDIPLETYLAFLGEAYHHVKHTVPLLMSAGSELPREHHWLLPAVAEYIEEEAGHDEWILGDIEACGGDADSVRDGEPGRACELMVAYAYDVIRRRNPLGFFGMVHVLEGTSARGATTAASSIQAKLGLPSKAMTYLTTHGDLDQEHVAFFAGLMDRIEDPAEQRWITHCSRRFFELYADVFRGLPLPGEQS